jgi:ParB family transcriptional regulator, chromosome partitioning protein
MSEPARRIASAASEERKVVGLQDRRLGGTAIRTYRAKLDIDELVANERQPRIGPKEDAELQRQIEANEGIFEPLLVEPHPQVTGVFRIVDGERRWTNARALVEQGKKQYREVPVEVIDRTLTDEERLRAWIYIHRQRKEWDAKEKEMVAYRLVDLVGKASAANILGITVRELEKLVGVFELSERFTGLREPGAAITWARELMGVSKALLTPTVVDTVVARVNRKEITNSKDLRKLRTILRDPVAKAHFLAPEGAVDSAMLRVAAPMPKKAAGLVGQLDETISSIRQTPWTALNQLRGDPKLLERLRQAEELMRSLRETLEGQK